MNIDHIKALAAVVDEGTVEGGAFVLGITASAASQRIRALESKLGQVLIRRTNPITVTEAGTAVLRYARQVELLESEALDRLHGIAADVPDGAGARGARREPTVLRIGANADSLATWFRPVFAEVAAWDDVVIRIDVVDQGKALPLLTSGEVLGTITSAEASAYGTQVQRLGSMRYVAVAARSLLERHGGEIAVGGPARAALAEVDLAALPMVNFGRDDDLQLNFLAAAGMEGVPPTSVVPSSAEFAAAVAAGVGWGMIPIMQLGDLGDDLVPITASPNVDVPLYWHHWTLASEKLSRLTEALKAAAEAMR
ncbi:MULTISPECIES: ArgP/LysG family DNA-binding transcriptional regulator [unclassified Brevibacterium]|uniref:ArgP/LysG family DNA-binding transcriptional regulator n=1 Tax=unclassified Brevibacterium TaxID=2614124 RepID=UPI001092F2AC|nr:ArgP/LysG family DNA-binding transcriptional regulator [Brevibacterium sp. S22]TGD28492.1 ArgP/LysG family DNA-binding transcriptional regulator [Brevibacterium sp. S22]